MSSMSLAAGRAALKLRKHSPQILFAAGIVGSVATVVVACRATLRVNDIQESHKKTLEIHDARLKNGVYDADAHKRAIVKTWSATSTTYVKLYGPAFILGVTSLACLTKSHQILSSRNAGLMAAYGALDGAFKNYRKNVVAELGEEKDTQFAHGTAEKTLVGYGEDGNGEAKTITTASADPKTAYGRWFDETNRMWDKDHGYNHSFLMNQQKWANVELARKGYLFLNEVYGWLGYPETSAGQIVGWVYDTDEADGYVDFGFSKYPEFVAGFERSCYLDFNVDGVIFDKVDKIKNS